MDNSLILFISPSLHAARVLEAVLSEIFIPVEHVTCLKEAASRLQSGQFRVILTEAKLRDGGWRDVLRISQQTASPSQVIVNQPFADARFWAEAINLGAFDVLAQPFDRAEIHRILQSALEHTDNAVIGAAAGYFG
jgi:DNA-binding NtrC family response regulator